jgi:hypothetical protein
MRAATTILNVYRIVRVAEYEQLIKQRAACRAAVDAASTAAAGACS